MENGWLIYTQTASGVSEKAGKFLKEHGHRIICGDEIGVLDVDKIVTEIRPNVILTSELTVNAEQIKKGLPELKCIARRGTGYEGVDAHAAREMGVECIYAPIGNSFSVSEITLYHILHAAFDIENVRAKMYVDFQSAKYAGTYDNIAGKTLGIFGCGNIGSRVAVRAMAMKMNVVAYDPFKKAADFPKGVRVIRDIREFLGMSDYVSIHSLVTAETKGFFNLEKFRMMKPTAVLINAARGSIVVEKDAIEAVKMGIIRGCEFDTCDKEPLAGDREVINTPGIYVTPHQGGSTVSASERVSMMVAIGIEEIFEGKKPSWPIPEVDYSKLPRYDDVRDDYYVAPDILEIEAL